MIKYYIDSCNNNKKYLNYKANMFKFTKPIGNPYNLLV